MAFCCVKVKQPWENTKTQDKNKKQKKRVGENDVNNWKNDSADRHIYKQKLDNHLKHNPIKKRDAYWWWGRFKQVDQMMIHISNKFL